MAEPSASTLSSGISRNEGETKKALRVASATWSGVPAGVVALRVWKLATSSGLRARRKALRPKVSMVVFKQPAAAGSQLMNLALFGPDMTCAAILAATLLYSCHAGGVIGPVKSPMRDAETGLPSNAVTPSR